MLRQSCVDERIVGAQELERTVILAYYAVEEQSRFLLERLSQSFLEIREIRFVGCNYRDSPQVEPLLAKVLGEGLRARVGQHSSDLTIEDARLLQLAASRYFNQLVVGDA